MTFINAPKCPAVHTSLAFRLFSAGIRYGAERPFVNDRRFSHGSRKNH
jgi:hypothetical protein